MAWARKERSLTQAELAKRVGISQSAIGSYEAGHRGKPRELLGIARALNVNPQWLESGEGEWDTARDPYDAPMFARGPLRVGEPTPPSSQGLAARVATMFGRHPTAEEPPAIYSTMQPIKAWEHEDELPEGEFIMVPRLEIHLSAGPGSNGSQVEIEFNEKQPQAFRAEWIRQQHLKPKKLAAMTARGNSMEPTIHDGDSLLIDTSQVDVVDGRVYGLWYEGGERVKRLYRMPGGGLRIRSDNMAEHPEIVLGADYAGHVRIIGRVIHRSGTGGL
jgi:phage repressor protein C with HTH and peptisase S24 domain/DNA-binding XRE family transcriptional regulator